MATRLPLLPLVRKFFENDPAAAANTLEMLEAEEATQILSALPPALSAGAVPHIQVNHAAALLKDVSPEIFRAIVEKLHPQQAAPIIANLPPEARQDFMQALSEDLRRDIEELLTYPENSAGRIMTTEFVTFKARVKVKEAIQRIRTMVSKNAPVTYAYVVDDDNRLAGVLSMRDLMLAPSDDMIDTVMKRDMFMVHGWMDREELANELSERGFLAAPVVDSERQLLGIVKSDQLIEEVQEEGTEDIQRMVGAGGDERPFSPVGFSLRKRLPWLHVNLITAFMAASVIGLFEGIIAKVTALAVFLPVVAGQGGNAGAQSLAIVMRGLVMREIPPQKVFQLILKEGWIGMLNGLIIGVITAGVAWFWNGNPFMGLVIGLAMLVNLVVAGLAGAFIPLMLKAFRRDPAQSSTIILTTVTDVVGFFSFLGFAVIFQRYLI